MLVKLRRCRQALNVFALKGPTYGRMRLLIASGLRRVKEFTRQEFTRRKRPPMV